MRKYWAVCCASIQETITYRGPIVLWLISNIFSLVAIVAVWLSVSAGQTIGGYTKAELVTYYVAGLFLQWLVGWFPFFGVVREIKSGGIISTALMRPISYFWRKFAQEFGWRIVGSLAGLIATLIVALPLRQYLVFNFFQGSLFFLPLSIILSIFVVFSLSMCLGLLAFWFTETSAINSFFWMAKGILGGQGIPISFIPGVFQTLIRILPFRYTFSFPLEIYFGKLSEMEIYQGIIMQFVWIMVLVQFYKLLWKRGRRVYAAFGQ